MTFEEWYDTTRKVMERIATSSGGTTQLVITGLFALGKNWMRRIFEEVTVS